MQGEFSTRIGERRTIRLADGSSIILDTGTRILVAYGGARRIVRLIAGQALFEVSHDASRPFTVEAAGRRVTGLGTVFAVRVEPDSFNVTLVRGRVEVERMNDLAGPKSDEPAILKPGQQLSAGPGAPVQVASVDVDRQLMWRDGFVEFDDVTLGADVAEINRYTDRPITIVDPQAASLHVSGVFRTGSPDAFVSAISAVLPVVSRPGAGGSLQLSRRAG